MSKHTPLPYYVKYKYRSDKTKIASSILSESGDTICEGFEWNPNGDNDAEFIVRACNSHDELLEAAKFFVDACETAPPIELLKYISDACEKTKAAIAKATGQP